MLDPAQQKRLEHLHMNAVWHLAVSTSPVFVTSDNPVVLLQDVADGGAWGNPGNLAIWSMSPTHCLVAEFTELTEDMPTRTTVHIKPSLDLVQGLNGIIALRANRLVFGPDDDTLKAALAWGDDKANFLQLDAFRQNS